MFPVSPGTRSPRKLPSGGLIDPHEGSHRMMYHRRSTTKHMTAAVAAVLLLAASCGGSDTDEAATPTVPETAAALDPSVSGSTAERSPSEPAAPGTGTVGTPEAQESATETGTEVSGPDIAGP